MKCPLAWVVILLVLEGPDAWGQPVPRVIAQYVGANNQVTQVKFDATQGLLTVPLGTTVRFSVDPDCPTACEAKIKRVQVNGNADSSFQDKKLPAALVSNSLPLFRPGTVVTTIEFTKSDTPFEGDFVVQFAPSEHWWVVADTVAYAVTRQQGNTAIAGAGAFFDFPYWGFLRKAKGVVRWSVVAHLLPPAQENEPADLGISPLGLALFNNRIVFGLGWNVSRRGLRPEESNRYFYVGFSASQVLNPTPN